MTEEKEELISTVKELEEEAKKGSINQSFLSDRLERIAHMAPDIAEVAIATLANPTAGIALTVRKIAELQRTSGARVQKAAEEQFHNKIKEFRDEYQALMEQGDLHKASSYLSNEANRLAENAVKLNENALMNEVFTFYKKSQKILLSSSPSAPLSLGQLARIKTDLGIIQLKVMWAESRRSALITQKIEDNQAVQNHLRDISIKENDLQFRVFLLLLLYISGITLAIVFGKDLWTSNFSIPWLGIPISIVFWSAIGSLANMLYKYYKRQNLGDIQQELRWVWARPLLGIIMGAITYLVVVSGLILVGAATPQNVSLEIKPEILWLFAFLGSFSDKVFEGVIEKVGLIAVDKQATNEFQDLLLALSQNKIQENQEENKTKNSTNKRQKTT